MYAKHEASMWNPSKTFLKSQFFLFLIEGGNKNS